MCDLEELDHEALPKLTIIWLKKIISIDDNRYIENLRIIFNDVLTFEDPVECKSYIDTISQDDKMILIADIRQLQENIARFQLLPQVLEMYIYSVESEEIICDLFMFSKVKLISLRFDEIIMTLKKIYRLERYTKDPLCIDIAFPDEYKNQVTASQNGKWIYFQLLLDLIIKIPMNPSDQIELMNILRDEYKNNPRELAHIKDFEENYTSEKILLWYSRPIFFYKVLNRALRTMNIHLIFLLRSYMKDLSEALEKYKSEGQMQVFRFQFLSSKELHLLQKHLNELISINCFFSTSTRRIVADFYSGGDCKMPRGLERVLFHIDVDSHIFNTKCFADISQRSEFPEESEVVFSTGVLFQLKTITLAGNGIWNIEMKLKGVDAHPLGVVYKKMKEEEKTGETNLEDLGDLLSKMGEFVMAEKYFVKRINDSSISDDLVIKILNKLVTLAGQQRDLDKSVFYKQKLLQLQNSDSVTKDTETRMNEQYIKYPSGDSYKGEIFNNMYHGFGVYVWSNGDRYEGQWVNNEREGEGTWTWGEKSHSRGDRYVGHWHRDKKHGQGTYYQANGDTYEGFFENDKRHGHGIYRKNNGESFKVTYEEDKFIG